MPVTAPGWLAARCESVPGAQATWGAAEAHTSPVYLLAPGKELFSAGVATYLMHLIEGTHAWVRDIATRPDPERHRKVMKVLEDARAELQERMRRNRG